MYGKCSSEQEFQYSFTEHAVEARLDAAGSLSLADIHAEARAHYSDNLFVPGKRL
jgi:hypothetical protein